MTIFFKNLISNLAENEPLHQIVPNIWRNPLFFAIFKQNKATLLLSVAFSILKFGAVVKYWHVISVIRHSWGQLRPPEAIHGHPWPHEATHSQRKAKPRNGTNAMEPNAMAVAATKQGETEMKKSFPKWAIWTKPLRSTVLIERRTLKFFMAHLWDVLKKNNWRNFRNSI